MFKTHSRSILGFSRIYSLSFITPANHIYAADLNVYCKTSICDNSHFQTAEQPATANGNRYLSGMLVISMLIANEYSMAEF